MNIWYYIIIYDQIIGVAGNIVDENPPLNSLKIINSKLISYNESDDFRLAPETPKKKQRTRKIKCHIKKRSWLTIFSNTQCKRRLRNIFHQAQNETVDYSHGSDDELSGIEIANLIEHSIFIQDAKIFNDAEEWQQAPE